VAGYLRAVKEKKDKNREVEKRVVRNNCIPSTSATLTKALDLLNAAGWLVLHLPSITTFIIPVYLKTQPN